MKQLLTLAALLLTLAASAQNTIRIGASGLGMKGGPGYGGELVIANQSKNIEIGAGFSILHFKDIDDPIAPVFVSVGIQVATGWTAHVDAGKVIYNLKSDAPSKKTLVDGTLYGAAGIRYQPKKLFYIGAQYAAFGFQPAGGKTGYTHTGGLTAGINLGPLFGE